jgi:hypothetical protein
MATKSGFSMAWKGFVDHKWSKNGRWESLRRFSDHSRFLYLSNSHPNFPDDIAAGVFWCHVVSLAAAIV